MEKELDDHTDEILSAGGTPGLGGVCSMEPCSCHSSPVISLFLSVFLLMPKMLMETGDIWHGIILLVITGFEGLSLCSAYPKKAGC